VFLGLRLVFNRFDLCALYNAILLALGAQFGAGRRIAIATTID
jgi:hypothetical protein